MFVHYKGEIGDFEYDDKVFELLRGHRSPIKGKDVLHYKGSEKDGSKIHIPSGVINARAMFWYSNIDSTPDIPDTVTSIDHMFYSSKISKAGIIPEGVVNGDAAFGKCSNLVDAPKLPSTLKSAKNMFVDDKHLKRASTVPEGVEETFGMWKGCTSLFYISSAARNPIKNEGDWNIANRGKNFHDSYYDAVDEKFLDKFKDSKGNVDPDAKWTSVMLAMRLEGTNGNSVYNDILDIMSSDKEMTGTELREQFMAADDAYVRRQKLLEGRSSRSRATRRAKAKQEAECPVDAGFAPEVSAMPEKKPDESKKLKARRATRRKRVADLFDAGFWDDDDIGDNAPPSAGDDEDDIMSILGFD